MSACLNPPKRNNQKDDFDERRRGEPERVASSEYEDAGYSRPCDNPKQCSAKEIRSYD